MKPCSGVLIHPRLVITAGHCVCLSRQPTPQERLPAQGKPQKKSRAVTRAQELVGVTITEIIDKDSQCASDPLVTAVQYGRSPKGTLRTQTLEYDDTEALVHPKLEVVVGLKNGQTETVWVNADLAAIILKTPVEFDTQPLALPETEVRAGDDIVMVGYGPGASPRPYGARQFGENKVTRVFMLETGTVVFRAEDRLLPDGRPAAHTDRGDSGGPAVKRDAPNVLVGITTVGARGQDGRLMSIFMSAHSHKAWLEEALRRASKN